MSRPRGIVESNLTPGEGCLLLGKKREEERAKGRQTRKKGKKGQERKKEIEGLQKGDCSAKQKKKKKPVDDNSRREEK